MTKKTTKKRFTFADAKLEIAELKMALENEGAKLSALIEDASLDQSDNVYDKGEQKWIRFYQIGFFVSVIINIALALS